MKNQQNRFSMSFALLIIFLPFLIGCSSSRTKVYPNVHFQEMGEEQAEKDIVACEELADDYAPQTNAGGQVVGQTAIGAAIGAAGGAVVGLITGDAGLEQLLVPPLERHRGLYGGSLEQPVPNQTPPIRIL